MFPAGTAGGLSSCGQVTSEAVVTVTRLVVLPTSPNGILRPNLEGGVLMIHPIP